MIWLTDERRNELLVAHKNHHPHLMKWAEWAKGWTSQSLEDIKLETDHRGQACLKDDFSFVAAHMIHFLLDGEPVHARLALEAFEYLTSGWTPADLRLGVWGLNAAQLMDVFSEVWTPEERERAQQLTATLHRGIWHVRNGNPHQVGNNWWAITHSGALASALALHGQKNMDGKTWDLEEEIQWAGERLKAFAGHFGEGGLYHEGLGYQCYTISHLYPALDAWARWSGEDILERFTGLKKTAESLFATVVERESFSDDPTADSPYPSGLSWNDSGMGYGSSGGTVVSMLWADESKLPHLVDFFDRSVGHRSPRQNLDGGYARSFFEFLLYPYGVKGEPAAEGLSLSIADLRQGLVVHRNDYHGCDDVVLGAYSRTTHIGGHSQQDVGSVRLTALNEDWAIGGGQARAKAQWQTVVRPTQESDEKPQLRGSVIWDRQHQSGAELGMDLRPFSAAYHERYVSVNWDLMGQGKVAFAMLDQIDDHKLRGWSWYWSHSPQLDFKVHEGGEGFDLTGKGGRTMRGRFLGASPKSIEAMTMPSSKRTYASGGTVEYKGRPYLKVDFDPRPNLAIYFVATIVDGLGPIPELRSASLDVKMDDVIWSRPFGPALSADFVPGESSGACKNPSGRDLGNSRPDAKEVHAYLKD